jgi:hypothetical protein
MADDNISATSGSDAVRRAPPPPPPPPPAPAPAPLAGADVEATASTQADRGRSAAPVTGATPASTAAAAPALPASKTPDVDAPALAHDPRTGPPEAQPTATAALAAAVDGIERDALAKQIAARAGIAPTREDAPSQADTLQRAEQTAAQLKSDAARQTLAPGVDPNDPRVQARLARMPLGRPGLDVSPTEAAALRDPQTRDATAAAIAKREADQWSASRAFGGPEGVKKAEAAWSAASPADRAQMAKAASQSVHSPPGFMSGFVDGAVDSVKGVVGAGKEAIDLATDPAARQRVADVAEALDNPKTRDAVVEAFRKEAGDGLQSILTKGEDYTAGYLAGAAVAGLGAGKLLGAAGELASEGVATAARKALDVAKRIEIDQNTLSSGGLGAIKLKPKTTGEQPLSGTDAARLRSTIMQRGYPEGFKSFDDFQQAGRTIDATKPAGVGDLEGVVQGSAARGVSADTGVRFDQGRKSDLDLALASPELFARAEAAGVRTTSSIDGARTRLSLTEQQVQDLGLGPMRDALQQRLGRPVNFQIYPSVDSAIATGGGLRVPQ